MFGIIVAGKRVYDKFAEDEMTVYAAQVSFFIILSVVPFIMLLLTAVQMIPSISNARFMELIVGLCRWITSPWPSGWSMTCP